MFPHRASAIPLPGDIRELEITGDPKQKDSGIFGVVVPTGKKAAGRLQGVKVVMRPALHRQFGPTSRVRFMLEENAFFDGDHVRFIDGRETHLHLVPRS